MNNNPVPFPILKNTLSLLGLSTVLMTSQLTAQQHWADHVDRKEPGKEYRIFGNRVNIRQTASLNGPIMDRLDFGHSVRVAERLDLISRIGGEPEHWYRIEYRTDRNKSRSGFIWGGLLAESAATFSYPGGEKKKFLILFRGNGVKNNSIEIAFIPLNPSGQPRGADTQRVKIDSGPVDGNHEVTFELWPVKKFLPSPQAMVLVKYFVFSEIEFGYEYVQLLIVNREKMTRSLSWNPGGCDPPYCGETWVLLPGEKRDPDPGKKFKGAAAAANTVRMIFHSFNVEETQQHEYSTTDYLWNGRELKVKNH